MTTDKPLHFFKEISDIPRGSGNESAIAEYLSAFAKKRGLFCSVDEMNNVLIKKDGKGESVILQGHTDMVCEKESNSKHDFTSDPIKLLFEGDTLRAQETTLGADDGAAVAIMLALLDSEDNEFPPLECIFTTQEETGLDGAQSFNFSQIKGLKMINIDSADDGIATVSCAGGACIYISLPAHTKKEPDSEYKSMVLTISGLTGGHSGEDINKNRGNAIILCAELLKKIGLETDLLICSIEGGDKDNAIPRYCRAEIMLKCTENETYVLNSIIQETKNELKNDPEAEISLTGAENNRRLKALDTSNILNFMSEIQNGVISMSDSIPGFVTASLNTGIIKTLDDNFTIVLNYRSENEAEIDSAIRYFSELSKKYNGDCNVKSRFPGWELKTGTPLQELYLSTYKALFGKDAKLEGIHAGLECGVFYRKNPSLDIISIGPDIRNLHSPKESMSISSFNRQYILIAEMLRRLSKQ